MIIQAFFDDTTIIEIYLPKDDWNIFPTKENFLNITQEGGIISLYGELNRINSFIKGDYIIHYQDILNKSHKKIISTLTNQIL